MADRRGDGSRGPGGGITFRGRRLRRSELDLIRRFLSQHPEQSRRELYVRICRAWDWRRPNGELRIHSCRGLLTRLAEAGLIELPAAKTRGGASQRRARKQNLELAVGPWNPDKPLPLRAVHVRPITPSERPVWRATMARYHYLGDLEIVGESLRYVAEVEGRWVALLGWGAAVLKSRHRESWIGWDEATKLQRLHLVADNVRFVVLPNAHRPNLASYVLARNLDRLSQDWEAVYHHPILLAETFVDTGRFRGTSYRAANWVYLGQTRGMARQGRGYVSHERPKALFVYPLHRLVRERLRTPLSPFEENREPGKEKERMLEAVSALPLQGRGGLVDVLRTIRDPRQRQGRRHGIHAVLGVAILATLAGQRSYEAIAEWAADLPKGILRKLGCYKTQAPSEPTIRRVLQSVDAEDVEQKVGTWLAGLKQGQIDALAIDGKTLCGSGSAVQKACHLVSVVVQGSGEVLNQRRVDKKSNEITAVQPLLENLPLEDTVVTADAMHTQTGFARFLVEKKKAHYVFIAKKNQPTLLEDLEACDWESFSPSSSEGQRSRSDRDTHDPCHR